MATPQSHEQRITNAARAVNDAVAAARDRGLSPQRIATALRGTGADVYLRPISRPPN